MPIKIIINKPFSVKQGLKIALEIARYELSSQQIDHINSFINHLDNSQNKLELSTTQDLMSDIKDCITIFKKSESIHWIRDDFIKAVLNFEKRFDILGN